MMRYISLFLILMLSCGMNCFSQSISGKIDGFDYVDLRLPSGTLWATCNVGASSPTECGNYYAWGETEEKSDYDWYNYKWCYGNCYSLTKYCTYSYYGYVDNKTVLDPKDDVAHVKWGGSWRMPTFEEQKELLHECSWEWTELNGVNGYRVTGPNGNSIFLPAAVPNSSAEGRAATTGRVRWSTTKTPARTSCASTTVGSAFTATAASLATVCALFVINERRSSGNKALMVYRQELFLASFF